MKPELSQSEELLTLTALKRDYRLSPKWIERLGPPDKEKPNPHYPSASAPMKLWEKSRVETFLKMHEEEYQRHLNRSLQAGERGKNIAERRCEETIAYARTVEIHLSCFPDDLKKACEDHLLALAEERDPYQLPRSRGITDRDIVNMLRHEYTNYHTLLDSLFRRIGRWKAYPIIKNRVNRCVCEKAGIPVTAAILRYSDAQYVRKMWGEPG